MYLYFIQSMHVCMYPSIHLYLSIFISTSIFPFTFINILIIYIYNLHLSSTYINISIYISPIYPIHNYVSICMNQSVCLPTYLSTHQSNSFDVKYNCIIGPNRITVHRDRIIIIRDDDKGPNSDSE